MALESVDWTIRKIDHWPLAKRREYLTLALATEKASWRRMKLRLALRDITTRVLKQEMRRRA